MRRPPDAEFCKQVYSVISQSTAENPVKSEVIAVQCGLSAQAWRRVIDAVAVLREQGNPIASSQEGYYLARTPGEIQGTIRQLNNNALAIMKRIKYLRRWCEKKESLQVGLF